MNSRWRSVVVVACLVAAAAIVLPAQADDRFEVVVSKNVMVEMRDGVRLATDIYRPAKNGVPIEGKFPIILERTPYNKDRIETWADDFVPRGYIAVGQDHRGRFNSEGIWRWALDNVNDGYDTAKWLGEQPWSDGGIGTVGTSYAGGTQHSLALSNPPYLKAMIPAYASTNHGHFDMRHNGAFELMWVNWAFTLGGAMPVRPLPPGASLNQNAQRAIARSVPDPAARAAVEELGIHVREYLKGLPLRPGTTPLKFAPEYESWLIEVMSHGDYDDFWKNTGASVIDHLAEHKDIPMYHVTGWYDSLAGPVAILNYPAFSKAKKSLNRLIVGPWIHGKHGLSYAGEAEFGPDAAITDYEEFRMRWFDKWLKGIDNGVDREPKVRIFVMGGGDAHRTPEGRIFVGGHWREENEWPLARTVTTPYYIQAGGGLSPDKPGQSPPTRYTFDPRHPVPTLGGNVSAQGIMMEQGAMDQRCRLDYWLCEDTRPLSARNDVLVFMTPPLDRDIEVTGRLIVKLYASSNAPDTDFTAKLIDVYPPSADFPGGVDLNIGDSIVRARYRDSLEKAEMMKPGEIYEFKIEMYPTSLVFKRGHRIRLDISSSNFPRFDVNPNTGEPLNNNRRWAIAENAVYHDAQHPSHILLPIIPAGSASATGR